MNLTLHDQIGEIVAEDYRTAAVFKANGIDFCCRGNRTLQDVITEKGLYGEDIIRELETSKIIQKDIAVDYSKWKLEYLIDHIIAKHHDYIRQQAPVITTYLDQIVKAHGKLRTVLAEIQAQFEEDAGDLIQHVEEEESLVFPMIRDLSSNPLDSSLPSCVPLNFFQQMISAMEDAHTKEGDRWKKIIELTNNFQPDFKCNVAHVAFNLLKEYYDDLLLHVHLENNILFPGALDLKNQKMKILQTSAKNQNLT